MADETQETQEQTPPPAVDPAVEAEARRSGWRPKDQFKGPPAEWVDAATFVQKGREVLPHVQRHAAALKRDNDALKGQLSTQAQELETLKTQVAGLTEFNADMTKRQRESMRREILDEIAEARRTGDTSAELAALDKLTTVPAAELRRTPPARTEPPATTQPPARAAIPQEMTDWMTENEWVSQDPVYMQAMNIVGAELRGSGKLTGMSLTDSLNATAKVVAERYTRAPASNGSSVEGGRRTPGSNANGGSGGSAPGSFQEAWDKLPPEVKKECDLQGQRLGLVGEKKTFKTQEAWRKHYLVQYGRYAEGVGYNYRPVDDSRPKWMEGI